MTRRAWTVEVVLVLAIAVGISGARGAVSLAAALAAPGPLSQRTTTLNASRYPALPWADLAYQLIIVVALLLPALLALHLARRDTSWGDLGLAPRRPAAAVLAGLGIAAVIGAAGLALYLGSRAAGLSVEVRPAALGAVWWAVPVLLLSAAANAVLEEVVVVGYLLRRLDQIGVSPWAAAATSAVIRASYHAYQGFAGFVGNLVMGLVFARWFQGRRGLVPLIVAHWAIDAVAFVGYALLADRVSWL